jgi:hypothetical protein
MRALASARLSWCIGPPIRTPICLSRFRPGRREKLADEFRAPVVSQWCEPMPGERDAHRRRRRSGRDQRPLPRRHRGRPGLHRQQRLAVRDRPQPHRRPSADGRLARRKAPSPRAGPPARRHALRRAPPEAHRQGRADRRRHRPAASCPSAGPSCTVDVLARTSAGASPRSAAKAASVTVGRARRHIAAGRRAKVTFPLNAHGRWLLRSHTRLSTAVRIQARVGSQPIRTSTRRLTVRRPRRATRARRPRRVHERANVSDAGDRLRRA